MHANADVLTLSPTGRKEQRMKEIAVRIYRDGITKDYLVCYQSFHKQTEIIDVFTDFPEALAFCEYHKLTVTRYYKNKVKVEKEEM